MIRTIKEKHIGGDCSGGGKYLSGLDAGGKLMSIRPRVLGGVSFYVKLGPAVGGGGGGYGTESGGG